MPLYQTAQYLIATAQDHLVGLPCDSVLEIIQQASIVRTDVPGMRPPLEYTIMHRGVVVPVMELRTVLGRPTFESELDELKQMLAAREQDHVAWLNELRECCATGKDFTKVTDPHMCAFGRWYDVLVGSEEAMSAICGGDGTLHHIIIQFDAPHRAIHGIAIKALELAAAGKANQAHDLIECTWQTELAQMRLLITQLVEGITAAWKSLYVVFAIDNNPVAFLVDGVKEIIVIDEHSIQPVPVSGSCVRGIIPQDSDSNILILDHHRLLAGQARCAV
ncbi:MAG: hypothetical protein COB69_07805 [Phycisphaera sp.]|nr:MAG: hypothetical protein COB69_07805 [Phycisphaera sp.]